MQLQADIREQMPINHEWGYAMYYALCVLIGILIGFGLTYGFRGKLAKAKDAAKARVGLR